MQRRPIDRSGQRRQAVAARLRDARSSARWHGRHARSSARWHGRHARNVVLDTVLRRPPPEPVLRWTVSPESREALNEALSQFARASAAHHDPKDRERLRNALSTAGSQLAQAAAVGGVQLVRVAAAQHPQRRPDQSDADDR